MKTLEIHNYDTKYEGLKPCPFCGSQPIWHLKGNDVTPSRTVVIKCPNCRAKMEMSARYWWDSVELAEHILEKWNKRIY